MANSFQLHTGDGVTTQWNWTKPYISRDHVAVTVDDVSTSFTWISSILIEITPAVASGAVIKIYRTTPTTPTVLTNFSDGSGLPESDLDRVLAQAMYAAEETADAAVNRLGLGSDGNYDAGSLLIKSVGDAVDAQDAVTKSQLDAAVISAGNVPVPSNPADDGKFLTASAGSWLWQAYTHTIAKISDATAFGKAWLGLADAAAGRSNLGLGTAAIKNTGVADGNVPLMDATGYPAADGSQITNLTVPSPANVQPFTSSGTWNKPPGAKRVHVQAWAGGGSGGRSGSNTGAGGGAGGGYREAWFDADDLGATEAVTVGAGGAGVSANLTLGNPGGNTTFGSLLTVYGGGGGGYDGTNGGPGGGGAGALSAGADGGTAAASPGSGGSPNIATADNGLGGGDGGVGGPSATAGYSSVYGGGGGGGGAGASNPGKDGGDSIYGGAGGGGSSGTGTVGNGGTSTFGGNGGAAAKDGASGTAGSQPGGGGGGIEGGGGTSGPGGDGKVIVTTWT